LKGLALENDEAPEEADVIPREGVEREETDEEPRDAIEVCDPERGS
jgi:hypothetical protein